MQNSMVVFSFSVLDGKQLFYANLVQNIKIISLSWNLVPAIILITFWDFLIFYRIFLKWYAIVTDKHDIYELRQELPNNLRLIILGI